jgi:hypothetical protein
VLAQTEVIGPQVNLPGSQQLAPVFFGVMTLGWVALLVVTLLVRRARNRDGHRPVPVVSVVVGLATVASLVMTIVSWPPPFTTPEFPATGQLFPAEAFMYRPATDLPVSADSERFIGALGDDALAAGFGGEPVDGVVFGVPFNLVDADTPTTDVEIRFNPGRSYDGPYPVTDPAYIESMPTYGFDNHYVALDRDAGAMWELIGTTVWFGNWQADAGARWDLDSLALGGPATTASRLPLLPGALSYDEVAAGRVEHVVWAGSPRISSSRFVWPAMATDGLADDPDAPPMGTWLRLRADADLSGLGPQARVIAEGLQRYGLVLADTSNERFGLRGTADGRWDRADLATIGRFSPQDFEVVDQAGIMVSPDSMAARPAGG